MIVLAFYFGKPIGAQLSTKHCTKLIFFNQGVATLSSNPYIDMPDRCNLVANNFMRNSFTKLVFIIYFVDS